MRKLRATIGRLPPFVWGLALLTVVAAPVALAAGEGSPLRGGVRNPSADRTQELTRETQIIARNSTYGTRQSNKGTGGGAIYGCRTQSEPPGGNHPCIRANNLRTGHAFEFETDGNVGGSIEVGDPRGQPFTTNGSGRVENLHADRVDATDFSPIWSRMIAGSDVTFLRLGKLSLTATCDGNANPTISANTSADDAVIHSIAHRTSGGDNRTADADFDRGETHVTEFTPSSSGMINYLDDEGSVVIQLLTQRQGDSCLIGGSAQGGPNLG